MSEWCHPNLLKAKRDYPKQEAHLRYWLKQYPQPIGYGRKDRNPMGERIFPILCHLLGMGAMEALGTACKRRECAEWHTNPNDR